MTHVALFHSVYGRRPAILAAAGRLRSAGHTVAAPDLYAGPVAATVEEGFALCERAGWPVIMDRAREALTGLPPDTVLAGLSLGAGVAAGLLAERPRAAGPLLLHNTCGGEPATAPAGLALQLHPGTADYDGPAAELAWQRALSFLAGL